MLTSSEQKALSAASNEVLTPIWEVLTMWMQRDAAGSETLRAVLDILEREGIAASHPPFGGTRGDGTDDTPIVLKVFRDGTVISVTPEGWGDFDGRSHGFHARLYLRKHAPSDSNPEQREGND